jgi:hypothetical protein
MMSAVTGESKVPNQLTIDDLISEPKLIIFESQLLELFRFVRYTAVHVHLNSCVILCCVILFYYCDAQVSCKDCGTFSLTYPSVRLKGSNATFTSECKNCGLVFKWSTQPYLGRKFAGNVLLSAGIVLA